MRRTSSLSRCCSSSRVSSRRSAMIAASSTSCSRGPRAVGIASTWRRPYDWRAHGMCAAHVYASVRACVRARVRMRAYLLQQRRERAGQCAVRPSLGDAGVLLGDLAGVLVALQKLAELHAPLPQRALQRRQREHRLPVLSPPRTSCGGCDTLLLALTPPRSSSCASCGRRVRCACGRP